MAATRRFHGSARRSALLGAGLLVVAACGSGTGAASESSGQPAATKAPASVPCPDKAIKVTGPDDWHMTNSFSGQQTWEGIARITNPNSSDVQVVRERSFAMVTVTKADGTTYSGYTGPVTSVLPGGGLVLAGKTIEMATSGVFIRPAKVTTAQMFLDVGAPGRNGCAVGLEGAQPPTAAARGLHICADGLNTESPPNIDIGVRQTQDGPACP